MLATALAEAENDALSPALVTSDVVPQEPPPPAGFELLREPRRAPMANVGFGLARPSAAARAGGGASSHGDLTDDVVQSLAGTAPSGSAAPPAPQKETAEETLLRCVTSWRTESHFRVPDLERAGRWVCEALLPYCNLTDALEDPASITGANKAAENGAADLGDGDGAPPSEAGDFDGDPTEEPNAEAVTIFTETDKPWLRYGSLDPILARDILLASIEAAKDDPSAVAGASARARAELEVRRSAFPSWVVLSAS